MAEIVDYATLDECAWLTQSEESALDLYYVRMGTDLRALPLTLGILASTVADLVRPGIRRIQHHKLVGVFDESTPATPGAQT